MTNFATKPIPRDKPPVKHVERPWGSFDQYAFNQDVTVSLMAIQPGQRLSLQSHTGRSELWIVLDEGAEIIVDDEVLHPRRMAEIWIPVGAKHRLSSLGTEVRVLEVAFGNWQQEDIVRFSDDYQRSPEGE
jgi:mannose-1-phosphate guanylyltransferase/mannose-6-phosphate isomerase